MFCACSSHCTANSTYANVCPCPLQDFEKGVADIKSRDVIEMMMITQYFDMLKDVGEKNATIFLNHAPSAVGDLAGQVRLCPHLVLAPGLSGEDCCEV